MLLNKKVQLIFTCAILLTGLGCKKYLDINKNLNNPTVVPVSTLLTGAELSVGTSLTMSSGLSSGLSVYTHQQTTREAPDQYGMRGDNFRIQDPWNGFYGAITDLDVIISQGTTEGRLKYVGMAKILKAFAFSQMVDVWGDIPFSEFDQFKAGIKQPKFDDDATIYPKLIAMIDEGVTDINNTAATNPSVPASDDVIYTGNTSRWIKAANTIKLKLYTQLRKIQNVTPQVSALLATPANLISANNEMFVIPFGPLGATDDRNPGFSDYTASQRGQNVSPWLYEMMKGYPTLLGSYPNLLSGTSDPRMPYYIYNQIKKSTAMSTTSTNSTDYRDSAFISLIFGSIGPNRNGAQQNFQSLFGIYPVGGRYDDLQGGVAASGSGTGAAPYRMITYADRLYLEAELINAGVITGNAKTVFQNALTQSFSQVDYVVTTYVKPSQTVPVLATQAATTTYMNAVLAKYDAASASGQLELIMTEKWLSSVGSSVDQYTDYRRTGYPILFDPKNTAMAPGGFVQPPINGNPSKVPQDKVQVARSNEYPLSLPWPQSEIEINSSAPTQKPSPITYKVFWMP